MSSTALLTVALHDLKWLQRLAALLTADADEADDLVQDTLVVAWTAPPRDLASPVRPWLATVLRNRFRMLRRSDARRDQRERDGASASASAAEPDHELARVEVLQLLVAELGRLAPEDQKIVVRRYFHGEAAADIGRALELPAATVRSRLHRSLQRLRGALDDRFGARERWSMAVLAAPSLPAAPPASFTKGNGMSITAKLILVSTVGAIGVAGWLGASKPTSRPSAPAPAVVSPSTATPIADAPRAAWEQRRSAIRRVSPPTPIASAPRAGEDDGLRGLMSACLADLGGGQSGAVTLSTTKIGAPDIGTIYDDITLIETTFPDEEVLECLIQSMHAWVGEAPAESFERSYTTTFVLGQPGPDLEEQRRFEFILGAHIGEVRFCERRGDAGAPEVRGEVRVAFEIAEDGRGHARASTSVVGSTDLPQAVLDCILTASQRWSFPTAMHGHRREYHYTLPIPAGEPPEADKTGE